MKITFSAYYYSLLPLVLLASIVYGQSVSLTIAIDKEGYFVGEDLTVHICLFNNSPYEMIDIDGQILEYSLVLENSVGLRLPYHDWIEWAHSDLSIVQPSDSLQVDVFLMKHFGMDPVGSDLAVVSPDEYTLHLKILANYDSRYGMNPQEIQSNIVHFRITEPQGETRRDFQHIDECCRIEYDRKFNEAILCFREFIQNHDASPYLEIAFLKILRILRLHDADQLEVYLKYNREFIDRFPNSAYAMWAIEGFEGLYRANRDTTSARELFHHIIYTHPGTVAARNAEYRIFRMNKLTVDQWSRVYELTVEQRKALGIK